MKEIKPPPIEENVALINEQLLQIEGRVASIENSLKLTESHENRLEVAEARIQASIDLTDDIVGTANNLITTTEARIDKTLGNADMVLDHADFLSSTFLVILGLIITAASIFVTWHLGRRQEQHMKDAIAKITEKLNKDDDFRDEFIRALVSHEDLRQNVNYSIQGIAKQMIDEAHDESSKPDFSDLRANLDYTDTSTGTEQTKSYFAVFVSNLKGMLVNGPK